MSRIIDHINCDPVRDIDFLMEKLAEGPSMWDRFKGVTGVYSPEEFANKVLVPELNMRVNNAINTKLPAMFKGMGNKAFMNDVLTGARRHSPVLDFFASVGEGISDIGSTISSWFSGGNAANTKVPSNTPQPNNLHSQSQSLSSLHNVGRITGENSRNR